MDGPIDFKALPPDTRAVALVGSYMQSFASMELALNDAIESALGLTGLQGIMVCKNMQFRDKVHLLKSAVDLLISDEGDAEQRTIDAVAKASTDRNTVAHELFLPDKKGNGVNFLVVKAKGKIKFPKIRWSIADFEDKINNLHRLGSEISAIGAKLLKLNHMFADAKIVPMNKLSELGLLSSQSPHTPGLLDLILDESTDQRDAETPDEPEPEQDPPQSE